MKKILTYNEAFDKLEKIVGQLEGNDIPLDKLAEKVTEANELIALCENKLRNIENQFPQQSGN
ncbi:MAG TPA: exodeoxyribonuclease VII small subunit [Cyclobacteriaceae bacterium]|nr:exodeoxyribonuclease VII small subunit [Cyclobacteriaceae bacterium]